MEKMKPTKDAHTFYALTALLRVCNNYCGYLIDSKQVAFSLKRDMRILQARINEVNKMCAASLESKERGIWLREWQERDYEVYASILFMLNDMDEGKREIAEQFMEQLAKGEIKVEYDTTGTD